MLISINHKIACLMYLLKCIICSLCRQESWETIWINKQSSNLIFSILLHLKFAEYFKSSRIVRNAEYAFWVMICSHVWCVCMSEHPATESFVISTYLHLFFLFISCKKHPLFPSMMFSVLFFFILSLSAGLAVLHALPLTAWSCSITMEYSSPSPGIRR